MTIVIKCIDIAFIDIGFCQHEYILFIGAGNVKLMRTNVSINQSYNSWHSFSFIH